MITHNPEAEKALLVLPEGTAVRVEGITGVLVFSPYPENYEEIKDSVYSYIMGCDPYGDTEDEQLENGLYDCLEDYRKQENGEEVDIDENTPSANYLHIFHRYHNDYEFGISWLLEEDDNVDPRDYGKPSTKKGTPVSCYEHAAGVYELISNRE